MKNEKQAASLSEKYEDLFETACWTKDRLSILADLLDDRAEEWGAEQIRRIITALPHK